ncbi:Dopey, N-terminal-domain-containing protein [Mycotypha africana]|uniref:Dopey, N-terminal-domain-containing protein n=1 Tax=Mycotypha africana TaxID=64632 RepID=UPI002300306B|nr:Dopey, N-terminal-domain-containing protein [Mycotypha africana]KAI8987465.1 Dopey, N-terminal-domain-containing protein [Mycotypha africana]
MSDNDKLSISQKLLKKISVRNLSDNTVGHHSESSESLSTMDSASPEISSSQSKEQAYHSDSRFRKYVQLVEKNLQSFDAVNEWADIISFLGRLLKSFQAYPQFPVIPRKDLVAKRLAQCLNPGFPAGVHQKTLEVYAYILHTIGSDQLADNLALWSTGLFPFVQYAATHVKPQLLSLLEKYYIPLNGRLRPAMRGFIIALLPALEEEGSEYFDQVVALLEAISETVELPYFYSCMWLVIISNPGLRPPALNYLLRKLPRITDKEAVAMVLGGKENVSLMVRAFSATLNDQQLLVQRGMLELLVQNFALKNSTIPYDDLVILMRAALGIVLRKDMSLNRRLYAWLLSNEESAQAQMLYFQTYAEKPATQAVRSMLQYQHNNHYTTVSWNTPVELEQQRPYKILISLMDKWEIGQPIVNNVFIDSLHSLRSIQLSPTEGGKTEVIRTANMWMDMIEPYLICRKLFELLDNDFTNITSSSSSSSSSSSKTHKKAFSTFVENLELMEFVVDSIHFTDDEIKHIHFPLIVTAMTKKIKDALMDKNSFVNILPEIVKSINLIFDLLERLPESILLNRSAPPIYNSKNEPKTEGGEENAVGSKRKQFKTGMDILEYARAYYGLGKQKESEKINGDINEEGDLSVTDDTSKQRIQQQMAYQGRLEYDPLRGQLLVKELADNLSNFFIDFASNFIVVNRNMMARSMESQLERIFLGVCSAISYIVKYADEQLTLERGREFTDVLIKCCEQLRVFGIVDASISTLTLLVKRKRFIHYSVVNSILHTKAIMHTLWCFLLPSSQLLHMRTVELLWLLIDASPAIPHQVEALISNYLIVTDEQERLDNYGKFGIIWELSENLPEASTVFARPIFLILDLLREGASPLERRTGDQWIRRHLKSYVRLLEPFFLSLMDSQLLYQSASLSVDWKHQSLVDQSQQEGKTTCLPYYVYKKSFDMDVVDYMFTSLITLISFGGLSVLKAFKNHTISHESRIAKLAQSVFQIDTSGSLSSLDLVVLITVRFLETEANKEQPKAVRKSVCSIQLHAADVLYLIVSKLDYVQMSLLQQVYHSVLNKLLFCIDQKIMELQQKLLHLLHACLAINFASGNSSSNTLQQFKEKSSARNNSTSSLHRQHRKRESAGSINSASSNSQVGSYNTDAISLMQQTTDLLVKCILDAFTVNENRIMHQHWMDFVLAILPYIRHGFRCLILPILMCVCHQINLRCDTIEISLHENHQTTATCTCSSAEKEVMILLMGLEKMLMFCLTESQLSDDWFIHCFDKLHLPIPSLPHHESSALIGFAQVVHYGYDAAIIGGGGDHLHHLHKSAAISLGRPRDTIMYQLPVLLQILLNVWYTFRKPEWNATVIETLGDAKTAAILQSFSNSADQAKDRLQAIFEKLFKYSAMDYVEGWIEIFFMENPTALEFIRNDDVLPQVKQQQQQQQDDKEQLTKKQYNMMAMYILSNTLSSTPQHIISTLLDSTRQRTPGTYQSRRRKLLRQGKLSPTSILRFTEIYCGYIRNPEALVLLWPIIHQFSKDYLSQASTYKMFLPSLMRFLTVALEELSKSSTYEQDRRMRRDAQELYQRCIDYCILIAGKSLEQQSSWMMRATGAAGGSGTTTKASSLSSSSLNVSLNDDTLSEEKSILEQSSTGDLVTDSYPHSNLSQSNLSVHVTNAAVNTTETELNTTNNNHANMRHNPSFSSVSEMEKRAIWKRNEDALINQINQYLASQVIPRLRQLVADNDKINSLLNNLVYYVIGPALKSKSKPQAVIMDQLVEMARMPFTYKTWRKEIWDMFIDNRFFHMSSTTASQWMRIIQTIFTIEKERMTELMMRISTTAYSTAFFTNKDQEALNRSLNLRRLSFVLLAGSVDQYIHQLPLIQEKIVELLKLDHKEMVHVEIYTCLRIILMRFSQKHLMNFWPVLITDLMRLFNSFIESATATEGGFQDKPEEAQALLAGCKFLDLLCALELDAFQIYQWIFIRDTVETLINKSSSNEGPIPLTESLHQTLQVDTKNNGTTTSEKPDAFDYSFANSSHLLSSTTSSPASTAEPSLGLLKRPMLTMHHITSIRQLSFFIEHIGLYVYQSSFTLARPDLPFIERLLQNDLLEEE